MSLAEYYIFNGIDPYRDDHHWEYDSYVTSDDEIFEEESFEDPTQKQLKSLKNEHEKALNADNLAYQEVRDAWDFAAFRNAKLGKATKKMAAARKKKDATNVALCKAADEFLGFAKSEELKPYSDDEKFLKEMQRETSALDGCWNLHRVTMKDSTAMDTTTIAKIMEMKERGAKYLNFQFLIGPGGSGSVEFQSENWTLGFEVERFAGVQESDVSASNTDEINFNLFNHWDSSENACDFEMFIINSDNEIVENALIYGNVYLDRINSANQEKMEDISYRVVINVFPEIEME